MSKPYPAHSGFINRDLLAMVLFSAITITLYSHTLGSPFVLDDISNVLQNQYIRISELTWDTVGDAAWKSLRSKRPVANISLALNYYMGRYNVFGYHLVNIIIHIASGIVLYFFFEITFRIHSPPRCQNRFIPFVAALIWLVHPVQTQAVTYIVQRMTSMAALFYILSMLLYAKARMLCFQKGPKSENKERGYAYLFFSGSFLSGVLALCSKENAATLPFFVFLYEWFFFQNLDRKWLKKNGTLLFGVFLFFLFLSIIYVSGNPVEKIASQYKTRNFTLTQRLLTEPRVMIHYLTLLVYPHPSRLNLDYDFPLSLSFLNPVTTLLSLGMLAGMIIFAILIAKRERLLSFCICWFLGNLIMESSVIGLEIIFEHRLYLPSMLAFIFPVCLFFNNIKSERPAKAILCIVIIVLSFWTYQRNKVWKNEVSLFTDCAWKSPNKERPHNCLGAALMKVGRNEEARIALSKAVRLNPESASAHNNYGVALSLNGRVEEAIYHFQEAVRILPIFVEAKRNLAKALVYRKTEKDIQLLKVAIRQNPEQAELYHSLGDLKKSRGEEEEAIQWYEKSLSLQSNQVEILKKLSIIRAVRGEYDAAISFQKQLLGIQPENAEACYFIASVYARKNQAQLSIQWLKKAMDNGFHNPELLKTDENLNNIRKTKGFRKLVDR